MTALARLRAITITLAISTLASNILSSILSAHLPDDPHHLASRFENYLHLANVLSVFGLVGAVRQHPASIAIFSNYLLLDTLLSSFPRLLLVVLLPHLLSPLCEPPSPQAPPRYPSPLAILSLNSPAPTTAEAWSPSHCEHMVKLAQWAMGAGVLAATVLQIVGALWVREYARALWIRELREEEVVGSDPETEMDVDRRAIEIPRPEKDQL